VVKVDLESGKARLEAGEEGFDPREIPEAVRDAGFTPQAVEITAVGEVTAGESGKVLQMPGVLAELPLSGEKAQELKPGRRVRLSGELEMPEEDAPFRLRVEEVGEP